MDKNIVRIVVMFLAAQFLGLFVGIQLIGEPTYQEWNITPNRQPGDVGNSVIFLLYVVITALIIVVVIKYLRWAAFLFKLLEFFMIFVASSVVFFVVLYYFQIPYVYELTLLLSAGLALFKFLYPKIKNLTAIIASAAVGALFGFSFDIVPSLLLVALISLYDFAAVFVTKHMVYMAKELSKMDLSFSVSSRERRYVKERKREEELSIELGSGDMAIPLMLAVSAYKISFSLIDSLAVTFGTTIGLVLVLHYVTTRRVFLPALPPLCFFGVLFLFLARVLFH